MSFVSRIIKGKLDKKIYFVKIDFVGYRTIVKVQSLFNNLEEKTMHLLK